MTGCLGLFCGSSALAVDAPSLVLEHLTPSEGMPQGTVMATLQDSQGFIWLGTEDGLVRYDGHDLVRYAYSRNSTDGLPGNFIYQIVEDQQKNLWLAVKDGGIARWNRANDNFTVFRHDPSNEKSLSSDAVRTLLADTHGHILVGTTDSGIDIIDADTGTITHMRHDPQDSASLGSNQILSLYLDDHENLWVGTASGLDEWQPRRKDFVHFRPNPLEPRALRGLQISKVISDHRGAMWVGTLDGGLSKMDGSGVVLSTYRHDPAITTSLSNDEIRAILYDRSGRIWVGTREGLDLLDPATNKFTHYRHEESDSGSLRDSYIMSLYEDFAGLIWIGTRQGGVSRWNPHSWELGGHRPSWLVGKLVTSFADAPQKKVWVGSLGGGLVRFDDATGEATDIDSILQKSNVLGDRRVMSLLTDRHNNLWIGTMSNGLKQLTPDGELKSIATKIGDARSLSAAGIMSIVESRSGDLWIGTHGGGANVLDPATGIVRQLPHSATQVGAVSADSVIAIAEDGQGNMWLGTDGGGLDLARPDGTVIRVFKNDPNSSTSLPSNTIYGIAIDAHGQVWIATDKGGMVRIVGSIDSPSDIAFEAPSREDGLLSDAIYAIVPDGSEFLWISGNAGLVRFNPASGQTKTFHREHGLQGEEFDVNASLRLRDGRLCFGGPGGFNIFDPARLTENARPPRVALTRLEVLGAPLRSATPYWLLDRFRVGYDASIVSLDFTALDFTSPKRNRLEYRIAGLSNRWIDLGTQHRITLTNLDAGDHLLEVRAANSDSIWSDPPLNIIVRRDPAPWRSPSAYLLYGIILLAAIGFWLRMGRTKLARIVNAKEQLEHQVTLRTRELVESNGQLEEASRAKSLFLARMSHELRTPMNGVVGSTELLARTPQSSKQKLLTDTISASAGVLLQIVNDLLDLSKMQSGKIQFEAIAFDLVRVVEQCTALFAGAAEAKPIELIVCPPCEPVEVIGDELRVRQILMNLVGNAIKFTSHGEVAVKTDITSQDPEQARVQITVTDTGIGMTAQAIARIFEPFSQADESTTRRFGGSGLGLAICKELVERMGGTIAVDSTPEVGSTFRVTLPLRVAAAAKTRLPVPAVDVTVSVLTHRRSLHEALTRQVRSLGYAVARNSESENAESAQVTIVDLATHESFVLAAQRLMSRSRSPLVVVATTEQFERLPNKDAIDPTLVVYKPVHRESLDKALRAAMDLKDPGVANGGISTAQASPITGYVLLVEDEAVNALIARGYLSELGCSCVWVTKGSEAVARCLNERFDLVMMDLNMPEMDGFATAKLIRQHEPPGRRTPIIALTAHDERRYRETCLQAGMDDLLSKPYTLEQFRQHLCLWINAPMPAAAGKVVYVAQAPVAQCHPLSVVDRQSVAALRNLKSSSHEDLLSKLVAVFQRSAHDSLAELQLSLVSENYIAAGAVCHKLAAASANVGALTFGREVRRLEQACAFNDANHARQIVDQLAAALPTLCAELEKAQLRETA